MIGILGAGNIGVALSCELCSRGIDNILYTTKLKDKPIAITLEEDDKKVYSGRIPLTEDFSTISNCSVIIVTYPSHFFRKIHDLIKDHVAENTKIIFVPGTGGVEYVFKDLSMHTTLIGFQRVPAVYRISGNIATIRGRRSELYYSTIPISELDYSKDLLEYIFKMPCKPLPNYLNITLVPSNPLLHTSRLYALFGGHSPSHNYEYNPLFYGDWDDYSSEIILKCDDELTHLKSLIKKIDLTGISTLKEHYESNDITTFTAKIKSIKSLHNIKSPMILKNSRYNLDWDSRYFMSDFPHGIVIIKAIALLFSADTPTIDSIINWYQLCTGKDYYSTKKTFGKDITECNIPQNYGIDNISKFYEYYVGTHN